MTFDAVGLAAPDRIEALVRMADPEAATADRTNPLVAVANQADLAAGLEGIEPIRPKKIIPYSAGYEHRSDQSKLVMVWGAVGPGASDPFQSFFALNRAVESIPGATEGPEANLRRGRHGGHGKCQSVVGTAASVVVCGWTGENAALVLAFSGWTLKQSVDLTAAMLDSIVQIRR